MVYLINPTELLKGECTVYFFPCPTVCLDVAHPLYGIPN